MKTFNHTEVTDHKTKLIDTDFGKLEVLVAWDETIEQKPLRLEECHGTHYFNDSSREIELTSIEIVIPHGMAVDILPMLTQKQKEWFINNLD